VSHGLADCRCWGEGAERSFPQLDKGISPVPPAPIVGIARVRELIVTRQRRDAMRLGRSETRR